MPAFQLKRPHHPQVIAKSPSVQLSLASSEPSKHSARNWLQAHGVLTCLYEVLLYAEGDDAVEYAQAAHAAAMLINKSVEDLDSVRITPMIEELVFKSGYRVEDSAVAHWR
ncbi:MAG TPA: hypothetical protein VH814_07850 [Steroidobacteraceae bacterium]|jgi:hypothetical protein